MADVDPKCEKGTEVELQPCFDRFFADHDLDDVFCDCCQKKTKFTQRLRFASYPKVLCLVLQRFVFDNWVPKKLEIDFKVPDG